jgi:hypothetical protein
MVVAFQAVLPAAWAQLGRQMQDIDRQKPAPGVAATTDRISRRHKRWSRPVFDILSLNDTAISGATISDYYSLS